MENLYNFGSFMVSCRLIVSHLKITFHLNEGLVKMVEPSNNRTNLITLFLIGKRMLALGTNAVDLVLIIGCTVKL